MESASMYERIMSLPLFKGTSRDQISTFLSTTPVEFRKYSPGELIVKAGDQTSSLIFILSGQAQTSIDLLDGGMELKVIMREDCVIGATTLFGMHTKSAADIHAVTPLSVMVISKEQYRRLLSSDDIYLVNYLNYLSYRVQSYLEAIAEAPALNLTHWLERISEYFIERNMHIADLTARTEVLCPLLHLPESEIITQISHFNSHLS